jgi:hypothetical protein
MKKEKPLGVPYFISKRFQNLHGYVWNKLFTSSYLQSHLYNIKSKAERNIRTKELRALALQVQWVVFLYLLRRFLLSGTEAAEEAVRILALLDVRMFNIGGKKFFEGSESVKEGSILADRLTNAISDKVIKKLILQARTTSDIIYHFRNKLYKASKVYFFDQSQTRRELGVFFRSSKAKLNSFGSTVNQTVEAYVFAEVIRLYKNRDWDIRIKNPKVKKHEIFKLKFSTRGNADNFSYVIATRGNQQVQIRHGLRVSIHNEEVPTQANICCDVAIINDNDLSKFSTDQPIPNDWLLSFAEVKHMSAFPELLASFVGMVHELSPKNLKRIRVRDNLQAGIHVPPFLYVSGILWAGASLMEETLRERGYDLDVYSHDRPIGTANDPEPTFLQNELPFE